MATHAQPTAETRLLGACTALKALVKRLETQNKALKLRIERERAQLTQLESQPRPDASQIAALRRRIAEDEERLESDEANLRELKDNVAESCG